MGAAQITRAAAATQPHKQPAETMDTTTATTAAATALPFSVKEPLPKPAAVAMPTMGGSDRASTATLQLMLQPSSCRTTSIACMRANDRRRNHAGCLTIRGTANTGGNCTQENTGHTMNCQTSIHKAQFREDKKWHRPCIQQRHKHKQHQENQIVTFKVQLFRTMVQKPVEQSLWNKQQ